MTRVERSDRSVRTVRLTHDDVIALLQLRVQQAGSKTAAADQLGVSDALLGAVLAGNRSIARSILSGLRLRRVVTYERIPRRKRRA